MKLSGTTRFRLEATGSVATMCEESSVSTRRPKSGTNGDYFVKKKEQSNPQHFFPLPEGRAPRHDRRCVYADRLSRQLSQNRSLGKPGSVSHRFRGIQTLGKPTDYSHFRSIWSVTVFSRVTVYWQREQFAARQRSQDLVFNTLKYHVFQCSFKDIERDCSFFTPKNRDTVSRHFQIATEQSRCPHTVLQA